LDVFKRYGKIAYTFDYNNNTRNFTFSYTDTSGVSTEGCLKVKHSTMLRTIIDYDGCTIANSATLYYSHPNDNITYMAIAYIKPSASETTDAILETIMGGGVKLYQKFGASGLLMSTVFAATLAGVGAMHSAPVAIAFFMLGFITPMIMKMTYVTYPVLLGIVILLGLVMWRLRK